MKDITILANTFHVKKFLCCIGLRPGAIFLLYFLMVTNFFMFLIVFNAVRIRPPLESDPLLLLISGVNATTLILLSYVSLYFPKKNQKYAEKSVNAKCVTYFYAYLFFMTGTSLMIAVISSILTCVIDRSYFGVCLFISYFSTLFTVIFVHFAGVTYSFYLSILKQDDEFQEYEEPDTKNSNITVMRSKNAKPIDGECSSNGSNGNVYVELPL